MCGDVNDIEAGLNSHPNGACTTYLGSAHIGCGSNHRGEPTHSQWVNRLQRVNPHRLWIKPPGRANPLPMGQPTPAGQPTSAVGQTTGAGRPTPNGSTQSGRSTHTGCGSNHQGRSTHSSGSTHSVGQPTSGWVKPNGGSTHEPTGSTHLDWVNPRESGSTRDLRFLTGVGRKVPTQSSGTLCSRTLENGASPHVRLW